MTNSVIDFDFLDDSMNGVFEEDEIEIDDCEIDFNEVKEPIPQWEGIHDSLHLYEKK